MVLFNARHVCCVVVKGRSDLGECTAAAREVTEEFLDGRKTLTRLVEGSA
ncbi:MAG: hypothetical protein H0W56_05170 [Acidothermales bacterium]|jgi:hypothetical protein|nr:hypothetical protein [Acidothermales bacterium]